MSVQQLYVGGLYEIAIKSTFRSMLGISHFVNQVKDFCCALYKGRSRWLSEDEQGGQYG